MDIIKPFLFACIALLLVGCSSTNVGNAVPAPTSLQPPADDASVQLAEAATSISQSLTDLNAMEKTMSPPSKLQAITLSNQLRSLSTGIYRLVRPN